MRSRDSRKKVTENYRFRKTFTEWLTFPRCSKTKLTERMKGTFQSVFVVYTIQKLVDSVPANNPNNPKSFRREQTGWDLNEMKTELY